MIGVLLGQVPLVCAGLAAILPGAGNGNIRDCQVSCCHVGFAATALPSEAVMGSRIFNIRYIDDVLIGHHSSVSQSELELSMNT